MPKHSNTQEKVTSSSSVVVIGYICRDRNVYPDTVQETLGGGAYFAGLGVKSSGGSPGIAARVGKDFSFDNWPFAFRESMSIDPNEPTTQVTLTYHDRKDLTNRSLELIKGASQNFLPEHISTTWLRQVKYWHIATMQPEQQLEFLRFLRTSAPGTIISVDSDSLFINQSTMLRTLQQIFTEADIVFMNRQEYQTMKSLVPKIATLIWKQDSDGASLVRYGRIMTHVPAPKVQIKNPTGAGDFFAGYFMACLEQKLTPHASLKRAVRQASLFVQG